MKLTWIGHSCFKIEVENYTVIIDPYEDDYVPGLKPVRETANLVLCSHDHSDHNGTEGVSIIEEGENPFVIAKIHTFHDQQKGALRGENWIHVLQYKDIKIAHFGDVGCSLTEEQIKQLRLVDVALVPIGGFYTIDASQAHDIIGQIQPKLTIPMHYRGNSFGFDVIDTVDEFMSLCKNVQCVQDSSIMMDQQTINGIVIMQPNNIR